MILKFDQKTTTEQLRDAGKNAEIGFNHDPIPIRIIAHRKREYPTLPEDSDTDHLLDAIENVVGERPDVVKS